MLSTATTSAGANARTFDPAHDIVGRAAPLRRPRSSRPRAASIRPKHTVRPPRTRTAGREDSRVPDPRSGLAGRRSRYCEAQHRLVRVAVAALYPAFQAMVLRWWMSVCGLEH